MVSDSPAVILYDGYGNPVGTVLDGTFYRLQVEAKLAESNNTIGKVDQGASGADPWAVDIVGGTVSVANLQQLSVDTKLSVIDYDLFVASYSNTVPFGADALLSILELRFSTASARDIIVSLNDGTVLFTETANTSLILELDFEDYAIDTGTTLTLSISQTSGACLVGITLIAKIGTAALSGNVSLSDGYSHIGTVTATQGTSPWIIDGYVNTIISNDLIYSGTLSVLGQTKVYNVNSGRSSISWQFSGTWTGIILFEKSINGIDWTEMSYFNGINNVIGTNGSSNINGNGIYFSSLGSTQWIRIRAYGTWTGVANWTISLSYGVKSIAIQDSLPSGDNHIGTIAIDSGGNTGINDAVGRIRIADPHSLLEINHIYDLAPRLMGLSRQDSGTTITHASPTAVLSVPAIAGRKIIHESNIYATYIPGKSHLIRMTGRINDPLCIAGMGYGDGYDGIFIENNNGILYVRFLSSTISSQLVSQSNWNLDILDGYGISKIRLDSNAAMQLIIDFSWLGVGRVRVGFDIGGKVVYVHEFHFSNSVQTAYMRTGSLPICWYIESTGTEASLQAICGVVTSEGGSNPFGVPYAYALKSSKSTGLLGVRTPLISLRPKALYNSLVNNAQLILDSIGFLTQTSDFLLIEIVRSGTLTGESWVSVGSDSHAEIDISATTITDGIIIFNDYVSAQTRIISSFSSAGLKTLPLVINADGTPAIYTLCVTRLVGAATVFAGFNWREVV